MRKYIICDVDGTISKVGDRLKYLQQKPKDWDSFYGACFEDKPIESICEMVTTLSFNYRIVFLTGRRESVRRETMKWLEENLSIALGSTGALLMRPDEDKRHDVETKPDLLSKFQEELKVTDDMIAFILEDRNSMTKKWRELGFTCIQVAEGDF